MRSFYDTVRPMRRQHIFFLWFFHITLGTAEKKEKKKQTNKEAFLDVSIAEKWHYVQEKKIKKRSVYYRVRVLMRLKEKLQHAHPEK